MEETSLEASRAISPSAALPLNKPPLLPLQILTSNFPASPLTITTYPIRGTPVNQDVSQSTLRLFLFFFFCFGISSIFRDLIFKRRERRRRKKRDVYGPAREKKSGMDEWSLIEMGAFFYTRVNGKEKDKYWDQRTTLPSSRADNPGSTFLFSEVYYNLSKVLSDLHPNTEEKIVPIDMGDARRLHKTNTLRSLPS